MNACIQNKEAIALLAAGELQPGRVKALRAHIANCKGCRHYFEDISNLSASLSASRPDSEAVATERFHRKAMAAIKAVEKESIFEFVLRQMQHRWALPIAATAAVVALIMVGSLPTKDRVNFRAAAPASPTLLTKARETPVRPSTFAAYEMVANDSLDKLDDVITREGARNHPPVPLYTASSLRSLAQQ